MKGVFLAIGLVFLAVAVAKLISPVVFLLLVAAAVCLRLAAD